MTEEEIPVEYDTTDVPIPETRDTNYYTTDLSTYFYNKKNSISNTNHVTNEADFTNSQLTTCGLEVNSSGEINISTTKKLLKYLKSLIHVSSLKIDSSFQNLKDYVDDKLDTKLNRSDYVIDNELKNSSNPLANRVIKNKFDTVEDSLSRKSNINHVHNMSDITSLETTFVGINSSISAKANTSDLNNHINNKNNPHDVNLTQLGVTDSGWDDYIIVENYVPMFPDFTRCRKFGKLVVLELSGKMANPLPKGTNLCTLKTDFRPDKQIFSMAYWKGGVTSLAISPSGKVTFGNNLAESDTIRIREWYFTS